MNAVRLDSEWLQAEAIVNAAHAAWSSRDLDRMLSFYTHDIVYTCNGDPNGEPLRLIGHQAMRGFLEPVLAVAESASVVENFTFDGTTVRTNIACYVKHLKTKIVLTGNYRQILRFREGRVCQLDEFHDAARLNAFWRLVAQSEKEALEPGASS